MEMALAEAQHVCRSQAATVEALQEQLMELRSSHIQELDAIRV